MSTQSTTRVKSVIDFLAVDDCIEDSHKALLRHNLNFIEKHDPQLLSDIMKLPNDPDSIWLMFRIALIYPSRLGVDLSEEKSLLLVARILVFTATIPLAKRLKDHGCDVHTVRVSDLVLKVLPHFHIATRKGSVGIDRGLLNAVSIVMMARSGDGHPRMPCTEHFFEDSEYIRKRFPEVEPLIPELRKRGTSDSGTIEILLASQTPALRDGEL